MAKRVCLDFDGVLAQYDGWKGPDVLGEPMVGAIEFINRIREEGYEPIVCSTRSAELITKWFIGHGIDDPPDVVDTKPAAIAYIDDRAILFEGNFDDMVDRVKNFHAYWESSETG